MQRRYEKIRQGDTNLRLIAGKLEDRLLGLDPLFGLPPGFSWLDIGCHEGFVLDKLVGNGADVVHGVDLHEPSLVIAAKRLAGTQAVFRRLDLCEGMDGLRRALPLLPHYDVVLCLGIYHHLARQMSSRGLSAFVTELFPLARHRLAIRSPEPFLRVLRGWLEMN